MKTAQPTFVAIVFPALLFCLSGCSHTEYELELTPAGAELERQLTYWEQGQTTGENEKPSESAERVLTNEDKHIAQAYNSTPNVRDGRFKYAATFTERMPDDLGGHGSYRRWSTPLGTAAVYMERIRGSDDLATLLDKRRVAVNDLTDFIIEWFEAELGRTQGFDNLRSFLDKQFRNDLQNLSIYLWQMGLEAESEQFEFAFRIGQYLMERQYVSLDELPELTRGLVTSNNDDSRKLFTHIQKLLITRLGNEDLDTQNATRFLSDSKQMENSLNRHATTSRLYRQLLKKWTAEQQNLPLDETESDEPEASEVIGSLVFEAFYPHEFLFGYDHLTAKIHLPCKPTFTNGVWNPEDSSVSWDRSIADRQQQDFPDFLFAFWCEPNEKHQVQHFGKVILSEKQLGQYAIWYNGLSGGEKTKWDDFIASLMPNKDLRQQIESFAANESNPFLGKGIQLLLTGLDPSGGP